MLNLTLNDFELALNLDILKRSNQQIRNNFA